MKKLTTMLLAVGMSVTALAGCGGTPGRTDGTAQTVSTDGSTSMEKVIGYLSEAYMAENDGIKITYNPTGSGAGIQAASEGRCDIGLSSRDLRPEEAETLEATVIAIDGIAMIVNPQNPV